MSVGVGIIRLVCLNLMQVGTSTPQVRYLSSVGPATGIEDEVADKDELVVCQQPVDDILNIRTSNAVQMISVYNLSGQQMIQKRVRR